MTDREAIGTLECMAIDLVGAISDLSKRSPMYDVIEQRICALDAAQTALKEREEQSKGCKYCKNNMELHVAHPRIVDAEDAGEGLEITAHIYKSDLIIATRKGDAKFTTVEKIGFCPMCGRPLRGVGNET